MDSFMLLGLVIALGVLLLIMVIVVSVANSLQRKSATVETTLPPAIAKALGAGRHRHGTAPTAAQTAAKTDSSGKQAVAILGAIAGVALLIGVIAFAKKANDGRIAPEGSEVAAGALHGTMLNARNSDPVVLIVPGSGPTDRDGNSPAGLKTDAYRMLAEGLADERIASVRVDKRGMFGSSAAGDASAVTPAAYVADIHAWIDAIRAERGPGSGCVFLLGHSEGALMVSLAAEGRDDVCGLILVAGMGRKMGDVIRQQLRDNPANAPVLDEALAALSELEAGRHVDTTTMHPALLSLFAPPVQDYLISVLNIDPVEAVRHAGKKTLVVQGKTDLQVSVEDAKLLNTAPKTRLRLIDGMNHVLKEAPADRAANYATYGDPSLPLAPKLVRRIEDFVKDND